MRVGLATGYMVIGNAGASDRCDYTVLGGGPMTMQSGARENKRAVLLPLPGFSGAEAEASHRRTDLRSDSFFVVTPYPFAVLVRHRRPCLGIGIEPVQNQRFDNPFGIGKMLSAVIFECLKHGRIEAVGSLDRFGFALAIG